MSAHINSLLCLGDSYTVGEGVPLHESFPYQLVQLFRKRNHPFHAPEIVAQTGWTTFELAEHLIHHQLQDVYDFVTLLIGVNNQYRELSALSYKEDFEFLVRKAIHLAKGDATRVIVVSIPDWGISPFAKKKDKKVIADAIDSFNEMNANTAFKYDCTYCDITPITRAAADDESLFTKDGLHPAGSEYHKWAKEIAALVEKML